MFRNIYDTFKRSNLMYESYKIIEEIHNRTHEMFDIAMDSSIDDTEPQKDLLLVDKTINSSVQEIRKKIIEYFALSSVPNYHAGLVLISLAVDYERIGDYTKAMVYLRKDYRFEGEFHLGVKESLLKMKRRISRMFPEAYKSLEESNEENPELVSNFDAEIKDELDILIGKVLDEDISKNEALVATMMGRMMRRISGHLDNVGSSGSRPFPKLGFKPSHSS